MTEKVDQVICGYNFSQLEATFEQAWDECQDIEDAEYVIAVSIWR